MNLYFISWTRTVSESLGNNQKLTGVPILPPLCPLWAVKRHMRVPIFLGTYFALCDKGLILFTKSVCVYVCVVLNILWPPGSHHCLKVNLALVYVTKAVFCSRTWLIVWIGLGFIFFNFWKFCYFFDDFTPSVFLLFLSRHPLSHRNYLCIIFLLFSVLPIDTVSLSEVGVRK